MIGLRQSINLFVGVFFFFFGGGGGGGGRLCLNHRSPTNFCFGSTLIIISISILWSTAQTCMWKWVAGRVGWLVCETFCALPNSLLGLMVFDSCNKLCVKQKLEVCNRLHPKLANNGLMLVAGIWDNTITSHKIFYSHIYLTN
jgi:hypothetical protein